MEKKDFIIKTCIVTGIFIAAILIIAIFFVPWEKTGGSAEPYLLTYTEYHPVWWNQEPVSDDYTNWAINWDKVLTRTAIALVFLALAEIFIYVKYKWED
ncbi:MAG: hypothetical protein HZA48_11750 [Planctomycetes bacterium]|nr:hypothetical protein [Planctomycetota bacterium]